MPERPSTTARPEFLQGTSDGGYDANPGDDDAIHAEVFVSRSSFTAAEICSMVSSFPDPDRRGFALADGGRLVRVIGDADVEFFFQCKHDLDKI